MLLGNVEDELWLQMKTQIKHKLIIYYHVLPLINLWKNEHWAVSAYDKIKTPIFQILDWKLWFFKIVILMI